MRSKRGQVRAQHGFYVRLGRLRLHVLVYRTLADLRRAAARNGRGTSLRQLRTTVAWTKSFETRHKRTNRRHPLFASIGFAASDLRPRYVVHEALHASLRWASRVGHQYLPLPAPGAEKAHDFTIEEQIAITCDEICRQVFLKLYALKVWT